MKRLLLLLIGVVLGWLAVPASEVAAAAPAFGVHAHVSFGFHLTADVDLPAAERGPPARIYDYNAQDAVDLRSHGLSARLGGSRPSPAFAYDHHALLVQGDSVTTLTDGPVVAEGDLLSLQLRHAAAKSATAVEREAVDVGHAGIHQFPGIKPGKSQFYDGEDLGRLSNTDGIPGVLQKNGNTRYVMRGTQDVGVDRTTALPTDVYTVIRKPDASVLTMFPGTSPRS